MDKTPLGGRTASLVLLGLLVTMAFAPTTMAQVGADVRIGTGSDQGGQSDVGVSSSVDEDGTGVSIDGPADADVGVDTDGTVHVGTRDDRPTRNGDAHTIRLHTHVDAALVEGLLGAALESPEVQELFGAQTTVFVGLDTHGFVAQVQGDSVSAATSQNPDRDQAAAEFVIRASPDAARSLANAFDPGYTAIVMLKGSFITVEATSLTERAALKALFSGMLDGRIQTPSAPASVGAYRPLSAAEAAIEAQGLTVVERDGQRIVVNSLGGMVSVLGTARTSFESPPAELDVRFDGSLPGALQFDPQQARSEIHADAAGQALRAALQGSDDAALRAALDASGHADHAPADAPDPFRAGLAANALGQGALDGLGADA